jgi:putative peptidoglycan lipid II flippase
MKLVKSILTVSGFTVLSRISGFVRDILIASIMGAGPVADAFYVAFRLPNFCRRLFAEGAFNAAFVPTFTRVLNQQGKAQAHIYAEQILTILTLSLLVLVIGVEIAIPWLMFMIAPGFKATPERLELVIYFTRITFPYILCVSLVALLTAILNCFSRFTAGAAIPILLNIVMIIFIAAFTTWFETPGHALSWAVACAGILQLGVAIFVTRRIRFGLKFRRPELSEPVRRLLRLMLPASLAAGVIQVNMLIGITFLSFLPSGAVSYFFYADRLNQLPLSLVAVAVSTALLPTLSQKLALKHTESALSIQNRCLEFSFFLILPATLALLILSEPMITVLFERGAFGRTEVEETAKVLSVFALGLPAYVMVKILSTSFFAHHDTKTPLYAAIIAVVANILLNIALLGPLKHIGIALATSLASWLNAGWLAYKLDQKQFFELDNRLRERIPRFMMGCLVMGLFLDLGTRHFHDQLHGFELKRILILSALIIAGLIIYFITVHILRGINLRELKQDFKSEALAESAIKQ